MTLVPIKRQGPDVAWLCSALEVKQSWWITHMTQIPLFVEILEAIKSKKVFKGAAARMPRQPRSLVPLKIRGRVVWFANSSRSVGLALVQGLEIQQLEWFMDELLHDIEEMQDQEEGPGPGPGSQACKNTCTRQGPAGHGGRVPVDLAGAPQVPICVLPGLQE